MASERLAEVLYKVWLFSDRQDHPTVMRHIPWLELDSAERDRWREVAEAALSSQRHIEDWHGKVTHSE